MSVTKEERFMMYSQHRHLLKCHKVYVNEGILGTPPSARLGSFWNMNTYPSRSQARKLPPESLATTIHNAYITNTQRNKNRVSAKLFRNKSFSSQVRPSYHQDLLCTEEQLRF